MNTQECTYFLIIPEDGIDGIKKTIQSIKAQQCPLEWLRVLVIDNATADGTYHKLLKMEMEYPELISVIRVKRPTTRGRLLKRMITHLRYTAVDSSVILTPGDVIYPDYVSTGRMLLHLNGEHCLVSEVDLQQEKEKITQSPIYSDRCILTSLNRTEFYIRGIDHKVLIMYRGLPISLSGKLPYYEVVAKQNKLFQIDFHKRCIYLNEVHGCIPGRKQDLKKELIQWTFFVKRQFYAKETQVFSTDTAKDITDDEIDLIYGSLASLALYFAKQKVEENSYEEANDFLAFAEMMKLDIALDDRYAALKDVIAGRGKLTEKQELLFTIETVIPPRECKRF